jgi:hypothetical protein
MNHVRAADHGARDASIPVFLDLPGHARAVIVCVFKPSTAPTGKNRYQALGGADAGSVYGGSATWADSPVFCVHGSPWLDIVQDHFQGIPVQRINCLVLD